MLRCSRHLGINILRCDRQRLINSVCHVFILFWGRERKLIVQVELTGGI